MRNLEKHLEKKSTRKIEIVSYDPNWAEKFSQEASKIKKIFHSIFTEIYHIGSTAIPGIKSKPIIDILVEVKDIEAVEHHNKEMEGLGYEAMGEFGIKNRRFFQKGGNCRTHHVHIFQTGDREIERHLYFKEYLIVHPGEAEKYSVLKEKLINDYPFDAQGYSNAKSEFIIEIDQKAKKWKNLHPKNNQRKK